MSDVFREALENLVNRLDAVHADSLYQSVWTLYMIHGGNYTGPKYDKELEAARAALSAVPQKGEDTRLLDWLDSPNGSIQMVMHRLLKARGTMTFRDAIRAAIAAEARTDSVSKKDEPLDVK